MQPHARPASAGKPKPPLVPRQPAAAGAAATAVASAEAGATGLAASPGAPAPSPAAPTRGLSAPPPTAQGEGPPLLSLGQQRGSVAPAPYPGGQLWPGEVQLPTIEESQAAQQALGPAEAAALGSPADLAACSLFASPYAVASAAPQPSSPAAAAYQIPAAEQVGALGAADRCPSWTSAQSFSSAGGGAYSLDARGADASAASMVELSGDSLLRWVRPSRSNSTSQSFSGPSGGGGGLPLRAGGGGSPGAVRPLMQRAGSEMLVSPSGGSFSAAPAVPPVFSPTAYSSDSYSGGMAGARSPASMPWGGGLEPAGRASWSSPADGDSGSRSPLLSDGGSGEGQPATIQHRWPRAPSTTLSSASIRSGGSSVLNVTLGSAADPVEPQSPSSSSGDAGPQQVEGRSESLLLWRLPARPAAAGAKKSPGASQDLSAGMVRQLSPGLGSAGPGPQKSDSSGAAAGAPGLMQKLDGFKKKLFGPDAPAAAAAGAAAALQQDSSSGGGRWSIAAGRAEAPAQTYSRPVSRLGGWVTWSWVGVLSFAC